MARVYSVRKAPRSPLLPKPGPLEEIYLNVGLKGETASLLTEESSEEGSLDDLFTLHSTFEKFRNDVNHKLTAEDLQELLDGMGEPVDSVTVGEWIAHYDKNQDGSIDLQELVTLLLDEFITAEDSLDEVMEAFTLFDKEKTDSMDEAEVLRVLGTLGDVFSPSEMELVKEELAFHVNQKQQFDYRKFFTCVMKGQMCPREPEQPADTSLLIPPVTEY